VSVVDWVIAGQSVLLLVTAVWLVTLSSEVAAARRTADGLRSRLDLQADYFRRRVKEFDDEMDRVAAEVGQRVTGSGPCQPPN
jgi:hypothetical protein